VDVIEGLLGRGNPLFGQETQSPYHHLAILPQVWDQRPVVDVEAEQGLPFFGTVMGNHEGEIGEMPPHQVDEGILLLEDAVSRGGQTHLAEQIARL